MRMEGIGAEISCLEDHSRFGDCSVVRTADKGDMDAVGGLENGSVILIEVAGRLGVCEHGEGVRRRNTQRRRRLRRGYEWFSAD
jgi:hypothetical protein